MVSWYTTLQSLKLVSVVSLIIGAYIGGLIVEQQKPAMCELTDSQPSGIALDVSND